MVVVLIIYFLLLFFMFFMIDYQKKLFQKNREELKEKQLEKIRRENIFIQDTSLCTSQIGEYTDSKNIYILTSNAIPNEYFNIYNLISFYTRHNIYTLKKGLVVLKYTKETKQLISIYYFDIQFDNNYIKFNSDFTLLKEYIDFLNTLNREY